MPRKDGTSPNGRGSKTGRGMRPCAGTEATKGSGRACRGGGRNRRRMGFGRSK